MNTHEAREILSACPPGMRASDDPDIAAALKMADEDPELRAWMEQERALDLAIAGKLREIQPPEGLREHILAAAREQAAEEVAADNVIRPAWWQNHAAWAAAACLLALLAVGLVYTGQIDGREQPVALAGSSLDDLISAVANTSIDLDYKSSDQQKVMAYLASHGSPLPRQFANLPVKMEGLPSIGCMSLEHNGQPVSLICFKGERVYHLYIANRAAYPDCQDLGEPSLKSFNGKSAAAWTTEDQVYVLTADCEATDLRKLL